MATDAELAMLEREGARLARDYAKAIQGLQVLLAAQFAGATVADNVRAGACVLTGYIRVMQQEFPDGDLDFFIHMVLPPVPPEVEDISSQLRAEVRRRLDPFSQTDPS